jgi:hypothetical protein
MNNRQYAKFQNSQPATCNPELTTPDSQRELPADQIWGMLPNYSITLRKYLRNFLLFVQAISAAMMGTLFGRGLSMAV